MNLKELIDNNAEEIVVKGSYNDVDCAFSIYDKQNKYEFVKILSDNSFLFKLKQKDVVMKFKLPKEYKKPNSVEISKAVRNRIGTNMATFDTSLEASNLLGFDYESPIRMIYSELNQQVEENMYKCVLNVGVDVNKEELYKALQYDRNQYDKGYSDAKRQYDRGHAHWEEFNGKTGLYLICSNCRHEYKEADPCCTAIFNYCPNCGAQMDEEVEK